MNYCQAFEGLGRRRVQCRLTRGVAQFGSLWLCGFHGGRTEVTVRSGKGKRDFVVVKLVEVP